EQYGAEHEVFVEFLGFRLHHQHRAFGAGHHHVQFRAFQLRISGVEQIALFIVVAHTRGTDGTLEGQTGNGQRGGSADHGGDVRIDVLVRGQHRADDLDLVHETLGEERTDRTVDEAGGKRFLLGGAALALEEATRDLAGGVGFFLVIDRQGKEVLAGVGSLLAYRRAQHRGAADGDQYGTRGLP